MEVQIQTDTGKRRQNNEDAADFRYNLAGQLLVVLGDGMGGHRAGDVASQILVDTMVTSFRGTNFTTLEGARQWLDDIVQIANKRIFEDGEKNEAHYGMGTTLVYLFQMNDDILIGHVGDSRAYRLDDDHMTLLTEDHTLVHALYRSGELTSDEAATHPQRHMLTRTMGMNKSVNADVQHYTLEEGTTYLLCSDGLTNMISDTEMAHILDQTIPLQQKAQHFIDAANEAGGVDNITVALIDLGGDTYGNRDKD